MRILLVHPGADFSVSDVYRGWEGALRALGHQVEGYNTNERLSFYAQAHLPDVSFPEDHPGGRPFHKALTSEQAMMMAMQGVSHQLWNWGPDVVVLVSAFYTSAQVLRSIRAHGIKIVIIHTESPYQDDEQLIRAQFADINILNDPANISDYQDLSPLAYYQPHCYDPAVHFPRRAATDEWPEQKVDSDFSFIGTMFRSRKEFFEEFFRHLDRDTNYRITMGGPGWDNAYMDDSPLLQYLRHVRGAGVDNDETARLYRTSRAGINFYRRESEGEHAGEGWAMGPREVEMAACGLPFARDPRGESDEVFPFLPSFSDPYEAAEATRWILADEGRREDLARKALAAIEDRTFDNAAKRLLRHLEAM